MNFEERKDQVIQWAKDRNLIDYTERTARKQLQKKVAEEFAELCVAHGTQDGDLIEDSLGDLLVTLIIYSENTGLDLTSCLHTAYHSIADRKGNTIDGVFYKEK